MAPFGATDRILTLMISASTRLREKGLKNAHKYTPFGACRSFGSESLGALRMSFRLFYVDESYDAEKFVLTGISVESSNWKTVFRQIKEHRRFLKERFGIKQSAEIHTAEFVSGRGRSFGSRNLSKYERSQVLDSILKNLASLPSVKLYNICLNKKGKKDPQGLAWDCLINRIERNCKARNDENRKEAIDVIAKLWKKVDGSILDKIRSSYENNQARALIISDEGREREITRILRKMHVHNLVGSIYGGWDDGKKFRNIPAENILEDVTFKDSKGSYFIQLADAAAFALLKQEVSPTPNIEKYGIHEMWGKHLSLLSETQCSRNDPFGIVRF